MISLCTALPEHHSLWSTLPEHEPSGPGTDPIKADARILRPDFEANVTRAFQLLALRWLDSLFERHEKVTASCGKNRITVAPLSPQGFATTLSTEGGRCKVLIGPCSEEFGSVAEATEYMTAAIRGDLRLRVDLDQRPHSWTVERRLADGSWIEDTEAETSWTRSYRQPVGKSWYFRNEPEAGN